MFDNAIVSEKFINSKFYINKLKSEYKRALPFPNIVIDNFFDDLFLEKVLEEFPNLSKLDKSQKYQNIDEVKFANNDYKNFSENS